MPVQSNIRAKLDPLSEPDFGSVAELATTIWRLHYAKMISMDQIDYMLKSRYTPEGLRNYLNSAERWFELLRVDDRLVGYCSYSLSSDPGVMKLEQLYLLESFRGKGLGGTMLRHIETEARKRNIQLLKLQVNKQNADSIAIYRKAGYQVREAAVFDIGNGYLMDDYVMEKPIH